jgi:DNA-binding response OmpR family regulator
MLNSGFDGYLSKPINPSSLIKELDRLLNRGVQSAQQDQTQEGQPAKKTGSMGATGSGI